MATAARARTVGAEVVVAALHWGQVYDSEPTATQRDLGPRLVASPDIDLVLGPGVADAPAMIEASAALPHVSLHRAPSQQQLAALLAGADLAGQGAVLARLGDIHARYVRAVATPPQAVLVAARRISPAASSS